MASSFDAATELGDLLSSPAPALDQSLLLLSEFLQQKPGILDEGLQSLDTLAASLHVSSPTASIDELVEGLFGRSGFAGDVDNYHGEENSFLDRVIERRTGMPITLGAVVVAVGQRVGLPLALIGLPGHVVVGVSGERDSFIDAFAGARVDRAALEQRLRSIFGHEVSLLEDHLKPMSTASAVTRVSNNLMRTWANVPLKFDRLLDLRSRLPLEQSDTQMLAEIAEARARFDVAARLREKLDPDDPEINALWGKLN